MAPEDLKLLLRKFEDPATGDVNYPAFVQAVDKGNKQNIFLQVIIYIAKYWLNGHKWRRPIAIKELRKLCVLAIAMNSR